MKQKELEEMREVERRARDQHFMSSPDDWPKWPWLPLKRSRSKYEKYFGVLIVTAKPVPPLVYFINLWNDDARKTDVDKLPQQRYESLEAIIADGWEVD